MSIGICSAVGFGKKKGGSVIIIPTELILTVVSETSIKLDWTDNSDNEDGFRIYISTDGINFTEKGTVVADIETYTATALTANTLYYFYVVAYRGTIESEPSDTESIKIHSELTGYLSGLVTPLSGGQINKINTLVNDIKVGLSITNLSDSFDLMYILAGETAESSLRNIVKNLNHAVLAGVPAPSFAALQGFTSDGANGYINTGYSATVEASAFTTNDASLGIYSRTDVANNGYVDFGYEQGATLRALILSRSATNVFRARINGPEAFDNCYDSRGMFIADRTAVNVAHGYNNRAKSKVITTNATAPNNRDWYILCRNYQGNPNSFSVRQISLAFAGKGLGQAGVDVISDAFETYMGSNGVVTRLEGLLNSAHCWFTRPRVVYDSATQKTFIGLTHNSGGGYMGHIVTLNNTTGVMAATQVGTVESMDDHNEPSILIKAADGKLFTAYSEHNANVKVRFRTSTNAKDATAWGAEGTFDATTNASYCSSFESVAGNIYIFYRENTAGWCYIKSTDAGASFGGRVNFYDYAIGSDQGYVIPAQSPVNKNIIHFGLSSGHPHTGNDVSIYGMYFDCSDDTFHKLDGTDVTASIPLAAANLTSIMENTNPNGAWIEDVIVDSSGKPRYLMTYYPNGKNTTYATKDLYYSEWTGLAITTPHKIHIQTTGTISAAEPTYMPCNSFNRGNVNEIIASKDDGTISELFKITRVAANDFTSIQLTDDSDYSKWRPFTSDADTYNMFWLNKKYYATYTDFVQALEVDTI